jgi:hypothetical protein
MEGYLTAGTLRYDTATGTGTITGPAAFAIPAGTCTDLCVVGDEPVTLIDLSADAGLSQFIPVHPGDLTPVG